MLRGIVAYLLGATGLLLVPVQAWAQCCASGRNSVVHRSGRPSTFAVAIVFATILSQLLFSSRASAQIVNPPGVTLSGNTAVDINSGTVINYGLIIGDGLTCRCSIVVRVGPSTITRVCTHIIS